MKTFAVIGLGRFGSSVATTLYRLGHEVLAVDSDAKKVEDIIENVTHAVQADAKDEHTLRELGIRNFDVVVVAIGQDMQTNILVTVMLKDMGVKKVVSKARTELHGKVLQRIGADRVVFPERDMGERVARALVSKNIMEQINLSPDYSIAELMAPQSYVGKTLQELAFRKELGVTILAIRRDNDIIISPGAKTEIKPNDVLVAIGRYEKLEEIGDKEL
ncbi:trk system potassium uptake protein TrkA [Desulfohalotomaculum tongense]|uniref:potassium channel family protein n=1 Tax=Desulforadius tongensis TaxID=1216062 RepID=UPI00195C49F8|nr:TrkA family potassium uptake protein [Desulforadius tongensis]MBM7854779.1 trk system potassium uptake protein TrkA [Desulforadius tongensis]